MLQKVIQKKQLCKLSYTFYGSTSQIPKSYWNYFTYEENIFFSPQYLKAIETPLKKDIQFNYIIFFDAEKNPVGFAVTQFINLNATAFKNPKISPYLSSGIKKFLLKNTTVNVLVCGNIFTCGEHHFTFNKNLIDTKSAYTCLATALQNLASTHRTSKADFILIKEFWPKTLKNSNQFIKEDFSDIRIDTNMVLKLKPEWHVFEDYLTSMRTKFRTRAKKTLSISKEISIKNFCESDIENYREKIDELYNMVINNSYFKLGQLNVDVFISLKKALKEKFIFNAYFLDNELIGFKTCFVQPNYIEAFHIGFDYSYKKSHQIYQRMLYEYVSLAIKNKVLELRLGRTSETIKSAVGAEPIDMQLYIRHRNSITNTLLKPLAAYVLPNSFEVRRPFKKQNN